MKNKALELADLMSAFTVMKIPVYRVEEYLNGKPLLLERWIDQNKKPGVSYSTKDIITKICDN